MITINLLPQEINAKAAKGPSGGPSQGAMMVTGVLILVYAVVIGIGAFIWTKSAKIESEKRQVASKLKATEKEKEELEEEHAELREDLEVLNGQVILLEVLDPEDRLFWSEKLNLLPQVVPDGVFLTNVSVNEVVKQKETRSSREAKARYDSLPPAERKGVRAPKREFYPEITYDIKLDGISYVEDGTDDQLLEKMIEFHNSIKNDTLTLPFNGEETEFMKHLNPNIDIPFAEAIKMGDRNVFKFTFNMRSIPFVPKSDSEEKGSVS